ncbi:hypothetical protein HG530_006496 [Fusarium avenaceum]|nr:hypothetical protein HG530_006496 [Fusarium avenaceum]
MTIVAQIAARPSHILGQFPAAPFVSVAVAEALVSVDVALAPVDSAALLFLKSVSLASSEDAVVDSESELESVLVAVCMVVSLAVDEAVLEVASEDVDDSSSLSSILSRRFCLTPRPFDRAFRIIRVTASPDTKLDTHGSLGEGLSTVGIGVLECSDGYVVDVPLDGLGGPVDGVVVELGLVVGGCEGHALRDNALARRGLHVNLQAAKEHVPVALERRRSVLLGDGELSTLGGVFDIAMANILPVVVVSALGEIDRV